MKAQEPFLIVLGALTIATSYPTYQRPAVVYHRMPPVYLGPGPALGPGLPALGPRPALSPTAAALSPLGTVLRHTNAIPGGKLDISELVDVSELVPAPLGPAAAALVLSPVFSSVANGLTDLISNTAIQNDPYLFQRGRVQFQPPLSPRYKLYFYPPPVVQ